MVRAVKVIVFRVSAFRVRFFPGFRVMAFKVRAFRVRVFPVFRVRALKVGLKGKGFWGWSYGLLGNGSYGSCLWSWGFWC